MALQRAAFVNCTIGKLHHLTRLLGRHKTPMLYVAMMVRPKRGQLPLHDRWKKQLCRL